MDHSRLEVMPGVWLDARRAVWFAESRALAVADLHLGYAWAHRASGHLLPISTPEDLLQRMRDLQTDYQPSEVLVLGDIVHRVLQLEAIEQALEEFVQEVSNRSRLTLIIGNHDRKIEGPLKAHIKRAKLKLDTAAWAGRYCFMHGHELKLAARRPPSESRGSKSYLVIGHEHPCVTLSDGVTTSARCPAFLISDHLLVLPAFSPWAAGCVAGRDPFMSPLAQQARFTKAVAILGDRLLPLPFPARKMASRERAMVPGSESAPPHVRA
jgi:putative SbcD/Mre11-related phosphoesterase